MDVGSFIAGMFIVGFAWFLFGRRLAKKPVKKSMPRASRVVGDVVKHTESGLPVLLLKQLSHDKFEACYITPHADMLGAVKDTAKTRAKPLDQIITLGTQDPATWPDYPHPLSEEETANFAKAMLT